jgi:hypothetical protein
MGNVKSAMGNGKHIGNWQSELAIGNRQSANRQIGNWQIGNWQSAHRQLGNGLMGNRHHLINQVNSSSMKMPLSLPQ